MLSNVFLDVGYYLLNVILTVFPNSTGFNPEIIAGINQISGYTQIIDTLVPMDTLGQIFVLVIAFELVIFAWKGLRFFVGYLPFIGGRG